MSSIWTIRRSATDTKVAGLCGGVADHWQIDPVLVRVGWALLALSGGVGVVLYLAGWLLIPVAGRTSAPLDDLLGGGTRRWSREIWVTLVVVACITAFASLGTLSPFGVGPALLLACIWYFGFYRSRPHGVASPSTSAVAQVTPFTEAADAWQRRIEEYAEQHAPTQAAEQTQIPAGAPVPDRWPTLSAAGPRTTSALAPDPELAARTAFLAEPDPVGLYAPEHLYAPEQMYAPDEMSTTDIAATALPRRPGDGLAARRLRLTSLVVLGLTLTGLGLVDRADRPITPAVYAATALLVIGLTLVVATWLGRARGLLPIGLLLVPVVVATALLGPVTHLDQWARATHSYAQVNRLPAAGDSLQAGELVVDLSKLPTSADVDYSAHLGSGRLEVVVPADADVVVDYSVGVGQVELDGQQVVAGGHLRGRTTPSTASAQGGTLTLHLSADRGQVQVRR